MQISSLVFLKTGIWDVYFQVMQSLSLGFGKNELKTLSEISSLLIPEGILLLLQHNHCHVVYLEQWQCHSQCRSLIYCGFHCLAIYILLFIKFTFSYVIWSSDIAEKCWKVNTFYSEHIWKTIHYSYRNMFIVFYFELLCHSAFSLLIAHKLQLYFPSFLL